MSRAIGSIVELRRFPVKSMQGERLTHGRITERGLVGDRTHALIDIKTGMVASAKRPDRWRSLLRYSARYAAGSEMSALEIDAPDGSVLSPGEHADTALTLSIGRAVHLTSVRPVGIELERSVPMEVLQHGAESVVDKTINLLGRSAPHGGFFDRAPLHLIAKSSLDWLGGTESWQRIAPRYRANIVVDVPHLTPFGETAWIGQTMQLGGAVIRIILPTPRCAVPTLAQGDLPDNPQALRAIVQANRIEVLGLGRLPCLGVYAEVLVTGDIAQSDIVTLAT